MKKLNRTEVKLFSCEVESAWNSEVLDKVGYPLRYYDIEIGGCEWCISEHHLYMLATMLFGEATKCYDLAEIEDTFKAKRNG